jgi:hypothetical protein
MPQTGQFQPPGLTIMGSVPLRRAYREDTIDARAAAAQPATAHAPPEWS